MSEQLTFLAWCTNFTIKGGVVTLVILGQTSPSGEMMQSCKCVPHKECLLMNLRCHLMYDKISINFKHFNLEIQLNVNFVLTTQENIYKSI